MREPWIYREHLSPKTLCTSCQNNSVIGYFMKRLCICLISMAISRSNKLCNKAEAKM